MNGPQGQKSSGDQPYDKMKGALIASVVLHVTVVVLMIVGLPYIRHEHKIPEAISVELATVADVTQTNRPPVKSPPEEKKQEPPTKKEMKTPPKAAPNTTKETPKPVEKTPEPDKKPVEVKKDTPEQDELAPPKKDEKKPDKKPDKKPEPKKEVKKEEQQQFQSLLKNWAKNEPEEKTDINDIADKLTKSAPSPETSNIGQTLTISDLDAFRQQLVPCWNIPGGAANADALAVEIRLQVNPDRTVKDADVMDAGRYNSDDRFRAAADAALRAVRDPRCSPFNLPQDKYDQWHDMIVNFDPKDML